MQVATAPIVSDEQQIEATEKRTVTYQLIMSGNDGMILASDKCERHVSEDDNYGVKNLVEKIRIDPSGQFAWAYAGSRIAPMFSAQFSQNMIALYSTDTSISQSDVEKALTDCFDPVWAQWQPQAKGPAQSILIVACGHTKQILRYDLNKPREVERMGSPCFSGQRFNLAAFLPAHLYSSKMTVSELTYLAAHSIRSAHELDNAMIDGLDIVVYRDTAGRFEFVDSQFYWDESPKLDDRLRRLFQEHAPSITDHMKM